MADLTLTELGECFDLVTSLEALFADNTDDEIPDDIDYLTIAEHINKIPARTPAGLGVKARVVSYMIEHAPCDVAPMVESFMQDLRRLGVLPPASSQAPPPILPDNVVRLRDRVLQLAA